MSTAGSNNLNVPVGVRPTKACVSCRRQKMRCEIDEGSSCRRCKASNIQCIFRPRANAAALRELNKPSAFITRSVVNGGSWLDGDRESVLNRLDTIEAILGISYQQDPGRQQDESPPSNNNEVQVEDDDAFAGLWHSMTYLKSTNSSSQNQVAWEKSTVKSLWLFFHTDTPGLHFLSKSRTSSTPTPLLLGAILYVAALHHTDANLAALAPNYFIVTCRAIAELAVFPVLTPKNESPFAPLENSQEEAEKIEQTAFENVLGILLTSLVSEGFVEATGMWISIGYRLTLDHCPIQVDKDSREWRGIFSGLQIIDLEHASLHLSYPMLPIEAPAASLSQLQKLPPDPFYLLTQMMHAGLSRFNGRGLRSIWSYIFSKDIDSPTTPSFTDDDSKVIYKWAGRLDRWLIEYNKPSNSTNQNIVIFRQYSLHRLFVLSIYLPARGLDLFSNNIASGERHELLVSARTVLKLEGYDKGIWSNWDLVMITWAALVIAQALEGGAGEPEDFNMIQSNLNLLQHTHQTEPSLRHHLSTRLESALQSMHTPPAAPVAFEDQDNILLPHETDPTWTIFDENSMRLVSEQLFTRPPEETDSAASTQLQNSMFTTPFYDVFNNAADVPMDGWSGTMMRVFGNDGAK